MKIRELISNHASKIIITNIFRADAMYRVPTLITYYLLLGDPNFIRGNDGYGLHPEARFEIFAEFFGRGGIHVAPIIYEHNVHRVEPCGGDIAYDGTGHGYVGHFREKHLDFRSYRAADCVIAGAGGVGEAERVDGLALRIDCVLRHLIHIAKHG